MIEVLNITDNPDGSANVELDCTRDEQWSLISELLANHEDQVPSDLLDEFTKNWNSLFQIAFVNAITSSLNKLPSE